MIRRGDIVTFKPEWRDPGDAQFTFVARSDEEMGRFDYSALELADWPIWPVHTASVDMVEAVTGHVDREVSDGDGRGTSR